MSRIKTAEDARKQYLDAMGPELGALFYALSNEAHWLHILWSEYVELFGAKPSRIDLLNKSARHFFFMVERALWDEALLNIARITDKPLTSGRSNLTIQRLPGLVAAEIKDQVKALVSETLEASEFTRDWRNRTIAHKDLSLALGEGATPLAPASRARVKEVLRLLSATMNELSGHYMSTEIAYSNAVINTGARELLYLLDDGLRAGEERIERFRTRKLLPRDHEIRDL